MKRIERIKEIMTTTGKTLAVAESITCGNLQSVLGSVSGASDFFKGGITAYNLGQKTRHLSVDEMHAQQVNCVSDQVAIEMAKGVCAMFGSSIGIGTTGYAEPYTDAKIDLPHAYVAVWSSEANSVVTVKRIVGSDLSRSMMQRFVADHAVFLLLQHLEREVVGIGIPCRHC